MNTGDIREQTSKLLSDDHAPWSKLWVSQASKLPGLQSGHPDTQICNFIKPLNWLVV